jgi:hypothetical protein
MENKFAIPLLILLFLAGLSLGYYVHRPETVYVVEYRNQTTEVLKIIEVTPTPTIEVPPTIIPTPTPAPVPDFVVKTEFKGFPKESVAISNRRVSPEEVSVQVGETVSLKVFDPSLTKPLTLDFNQTYKRDISSGTEIFFTLNKKGIYRFVVYLMPEEISVLPQEYGRGEIHVY